MNKLRRSASIVCKADHCRLEHLSVAIKQLTRQNQHRPPVGVKAEHEQRSELTDEGHRDGPAPQQWSTIARGNFIAGFADIGDHDLCLVDKKCTHSRPISGGNKAAFNALHGLRGIDDGTIAQSPNDHRVTARRAESRHALRIRGGCRGLNHGYRADVLARLPRLIYKQIDMRLQKAAGAKLDDWYCQRYFAFSCIPCPLKRFGGLEKRILSTKDKKMTRASNCFFRINWLLAVPGAQMTDPNCLMRQAPRLSTATAFLSHFQSVKAARNLIDFD